MHAPRFPNFLFSWGGGMRTAGRVEQRFMRQKLEVADGSSCWSIFFSSCFYSVRERKAPLLELPLVLLLELSCTLHCESSQSGKRRARVNQDSWLSYIRSKTNIEISLKKQQSAHRGKVGLESFFHLRVSSFKAAEATAAAAPVDIVRFVLFFFFCFSPPLFFSTFRFHSLHCECS